jgi:hypothetical protein
MKAIIDGKRYDTATAERVCGLSCTFFPNDFGWHDTDLYRTKNGAWFLAGEGNAASMWAQPVTGGGRGSGQGIRPISDDEARRILEDENQTSALERHFKIEEA